MLRALSLLSCLLLASVCALAQDNAPDKLPSLFVFVFEPGPAWVGGKPMEKQDLREHAAYHARLVKERRSFAAGGFVGRDGGMAIVRARDEAEAEAIRNADPAIKNGVFAVRITRWAPRFVGSEPIGNAAPRRTP